MLGQLSIGCSDRAVNAAAKAGKLVPIRPVADTDRVAAELAPLVADLLANGFQGGSPNYPDSSFIGSGPGEHTTGGKSLASYFNSAWAGHAKQVGPALAVRSRSAVGALIVVNLPGGTPAAPYQLPFRLFVVWANVPNVTAGWLLLHIHFGVAAPR